MNWGIALKNVEDRELKPKGPYWIITLILFLLSIFFLHLQFIASKNEDNILPCGFFLFVIFSLGIIVNLTLRIVFFIASPEWREKTRIAIFDEIQESDRFEYLIDGIKPFYKSIIKELSILWFIIMLYLTIASRGAALFSGLALIFLSGFIGQLIFLSAVTMTALWKTYYAERFKLTDCNSLGTVLFLLLLQIVWTIAIHSVYSYLVEQQMPVEYSYSSLSMAIPLQLSALFFQAVFFTYYKRLKDKMAELEVGQE